MSWRPQNWSDYLRKKTDKWNRHPQPWIFDAFMEFGADAMLEAVSEEIAKVENPFDGELTLDPEYGAFECCRKNILTLLKEK